MAVWCSLWFFGIFLPFWYFLDQEKSGNPGLDYDVGRRRNGHVRPDLMMIIGARNKAEIYFSGQKSQKLGLPRGCQILLGARYQNWKNVPSEHKMVIKYSKYP
jgi:hypothetical protein